MVNTKNNRLEEILNLRGLKQSELVEMTGIKKTTINGWVKQKYQPKQNALYIMAKVLDVSELWLAGYDCPMERPVEQKKMDELSQLIQDLRNNDILFSICKEISNLSDDQLDAIAVMVSALKK